VLDGSKIAKQELAAKQDGPSTAAAVLASKQTTPDHQLSYETLADNIVAKMRRAFL
jgi:hypothetical protein